MSRNNAGLSTERIVTEALHIIDGLGLGKLTMRRLGDALQVEAMAIYHHFPLGKEQLFDAIVEFITDADRIRAEAAAADADAEPDGTEPDEPAPDNRPWDQRLRSWAADYRTALLRHSGALTLIINRRPDTEPALRALELHCAAFEEAGLRGAAVLDAAAALDSYVTGAVIHQVRATSIATPDAPRPDGRFPHVVALRAAQSPDAVDHDARFGAGLDALLAGVTAAPGHR
ncbi:TetR family transcriptional regulator [Murinocardiopsis flavida]|uniref:TetR family transcriptional regulator n=1 Tax=Murinocardiopsis flavida TaxID=645275 RepID=A0A2P8DSD8_9ACTN|nr:TetR/AcrR family transcriptional regulator C-terminal domain-containing protein [Murinocardiopsis flavida]PSL00127.1 TetR family transcriptional regulator [Murinocardiopsis flavida]